MIVAVLYVRGIADYPQILTKRVAKINKAYRMLMVQSAALYTWQSELDAGAELDDHSDDEFLDYDPYEHDSDSELSGMYNTTDSKE